MKNQIRSLDDLAESVATDPDLEQKVKANPAQALAALAAAQPAALQSDKWVYRIVVLCLGSAVLIAMIGAIMLSWSATKDSPREVPQILTAIGSAAVGALAGLLAPSPAVRQT